MRKKGISEEAIHLVSYKNALTAYGQSGQMNENDWLNPQPVEQYDSLSGNTVLRGGQTPEQKDSEIVEN